MTVTQVAERQDSYVTAFDAFRHEPAFGPAWLRDAREAAFARFAERGFPTTREEEWQHTNVAPIAAVPFARAAAGAAEPTRKALEPFLYDGTIRTQIVVVNGRVSKSLSQMNALPVGVTVTSLSDAVTSNGDGPRFGQLVPDAFPFASLNTALFEDAVVIRVAAKTIVAEPLHVLFVAAPGAGPLVASPRLLVVAESASQLKLVESYAGVGAGASLTNAVTEVFVADGAIVDHVKLQREQASAFHVATLAVRCERSGVFTSQSLSLGGKIVRNDIATHLDGEGAECTLNGLYLAGGDSLVDNHTLIDHAAPHCPSHEVYKGVMWGKARAVFNGKIIVRQIAQKTDAKQTNKALLLSDDAQINTKPQLEIFADDVKCTHGAAIGQLDDDSLFYLQARGISRLDARNMLVHAFAGDILNRITIAPVRQRIEQVIDAQLP
jgi:Fe-S cluster assembly protein SufD